MARRHCLLYDRPEGREEGYYAEVGRDYEKITRQLLIR